MPFAPENPLEEILARAASDPTARPQFYGLLMQSPLLVLGEVEAHDACDDAITHLDRAFRLAQVTSRGRTFHPLFTSMTRLRAFDDTGTPHFTIIGETLFRSTRGTAFALNCGSEPGKELLPEEIGVLLDAMDRAAAPRRAASRTAGRPSIAVRQPDPYPGRLTGALGIYFLNRSQVVAAHLLETMTGENEPPHLLIGLVAHGDCRRIAVEIGEVAASVRAPRPIDITLLDPARPRSALQSRLLAIPPFYARPITPQRQGMH